jgi:hypothetical protein
MLDASAGSPEREGVEKRKHDRAFADAANLGHRENPRIAGVDVMKVPIAHDGIEMAVGITGSHHVADSEGGLWGAIIQNGADFLPTVSGRANSLLGAICTGDAESALEQDLEQPIALAAKIEDVCRGRKLD